MRTFHTRPLLRIVEGTSDMLVVRGRLNSEISAGVESRLGEFPRDVAVQFNIFTTPNETVDYASKPIAYMPDEFAFDLDVESLGRLAREQLIRMLPLYAAAWESGNPPLTIADLWIGGQDELLTKDERARLQRAMRQVWSLPIQGKVFVLDEESLRDHASWLGTPAAIREAGGVVHREVSPACDYYLTDRPDTAEAARRAGAKQVIDTLTLTVMISSRD